MTDPPEPPYRRSAAPIELELRLRSPPWVWLSALAFAAVAVWALLRRSGVGLVYAGVAALFAFALLRLRGRLRILRRMLVIENGYGQGRYSLDSAQLSHGTNESGERYLRLRCREGEVWLSRGMLGGQRNFEELQRRLREHGVECKGEETPR